MFSISLGSPLYWLSWERRGVVGGVACGPPLPLPLSAHYWLPSRNRNPEMKSPQLVCWIIYVYPFVGFGLWQQPARPRQGTQMNRYCNSKPFKSPNSQAGGDEGGGWWVLSQINCSALSIHLVDIYLFRIVSAVCWIIMFRKHPPGAVYQQNIELNAKKCSVWLFDTLKMKTSCFLWQIIHWYYSDKTFIRACQCWKHHGDFSIQMYFYE